MSEVFADTGYWIALISEHDRLHERAMATTERIGARPIVTTQMVLVELLDGASETGADGRRGAWEFARDLETDPRVTIVPQTAEQYDAALDRYAARGDQTWSLTDCASFLVMEERDIVEALAHDRDFEQAGFVCLLRDARA